MTVRVLVADRTGRILNEMEPEVGPVSWRLSKVGRCVLQFATQDPKVTEDNLRFGNRVLLEFSNGLTPWAGVLDPPREWTKGFVTVTCQSAEAIFGYRQTGKGKYFTNQTIGEMFQDLILEGNAQADMGIGVGTVSAGGDVFTMEYHFENLLEIFQQSLCGRLSEYDFDVTAVEQAGHIVLSANLYSRAGGVKPNVVLMEDHNLTSILLREQGPIVNAWDVAGGGQGWGSERLTSFSDDVESVTTWGLRQGAKIFNDVTDQLTLDTHATVLKNEWKEPQNILELTAIDKAPAEFSDYIVGDSVRALLPSFGFGGGYDGLVRVLGREFDPITGACELVVEEVEDAE